MDRFSPSQVDSGVVMRALGSGEGFLLVAGRPPVLAIALPLAQWRSDVTDTYDLEHAERIGLSDLSASLIVNIVAGQVDENWKPFLCAVLTVSGQDAMLIVPANSYWRERVGDA